MSCVQRTFEGDDEGDKVSLSLVDQDDVDVTVGSDSFGTCTFHFGGKHSCEEPTLRVLSGLDYPGRKKQILDYGIEDEGQVENQIQILELGQ